MHLSVNIDLIGVSIMLTNVTCIILEKPLCIHTLFEVLTITVQISENTCSVGLGWNRSQIVHQTCSSPQYWGSNI